MSPTDDPKQVQYPHRLSATAWHLRAPDGGRSAGFSGTNDLHRLLPLHVKQHPLPDPVLEATNGHMLQMLLTHAQYEPLMPASSATAATSSAPSRRFTRGGSASAAAEESLQAAPQPPAWLLLLKFCIDRRVFILHHLPLTIAVTWYFSERTIPNTKEPLNGTSAHCLHPAGTALPSSTPARCWREQACPTSQQRR